MPAFDIKSCSIIWSLGEEFCTVCWKACPMNQLDDMVIRQLAANWLNKAGISKPPIIRTVCGCMTVLEGAPPF